MGNDANMNREQEKKAWNMDLRNVFNDMGETD